MYPRSRSYFAESRSHSTGKGLLLLEGKRFPLYRQLAGHCIASWQGKCNDSKCSLVWDESGKISHDLQADSFVGKPRPVSNG